MAFVICLSGSGEDHMEFRRLYQSIRRRGWRFRCSTASYRFLFSTITGVFVSATIAERKKTNPAATKKSIVEQFTVGVFGGSVVRTNNTTQ